MWLSHLISTYTTMLSRVKLGSVPKHVSTTAPLSIFSQNILFISCLLKSLVCLLSLLNISQTFSACSFFYDTVFKFIAWTTAGDNLFPVWLQIQMTELILWHRTPSIPKKFWEKASLPGMQTSIWVKIKLPLLLRESISEPSGHRNQEVAWNRSLLVSVH